ncbi:MAG: NTP transferase domain-containing protein [Actinomycetaceae bacterium]|nr:NTP transferase domain-containing protein [Actinomycetaceae bacterium]
MVGIIFLGGGTARRFGGEAKQHLTIAGKTLLEHGFAFARYCFPNAVCVAVTPEDSRVPAGMLRTLEDPPLGGPVAGISAGLDALLEQAPHLLDHETYVAVLSGDSPTSALLLPELLQAIHGHSGAVCARGEKTNYLTGIYRLSTLRAALPDNPHGAGAYRTFKHLDLALVNDDRGLSRDVDSPADVATVSDIVRRELAQHTAPSSTLAVGQAHTQLS